MLMEAKSFQFAVTVRTLLRIDDEFASQSSKITRLQDIHQVVERIGDAVKDLFGTFRGGPRTATDAQRVERRMDAEHARRSLSFCHANSTSAQRACSPTWLVIDEWMKVIKFGTRRRGEWRPGPTC